MTIRNTKLAGTDFTSTTEATFTDLNDTFDALNALTSINQFVQIGLNSIRQMIDRDAIVSGGKIDGFAEAYIDTGGRKNTVTIAGSTDATFDVDKYKITGAVSSYIKHTVPTNLFVSSVNNVIGVPMYEDFEPGASCTYRLYNSTTDTGYLESNVLQSITAFTEMPRFIMVKITPSTISTTASYPSINGFYVMARNI